MISKTIRDGKRNYSCDECLHELERFSSYDQARHAGWAISYDRKKCYCPNCAELHRYVGRGGVKFNHKRESTLGE